MTTSEFNYEFDILYDNIASKGAPGINKYEKSIFLTTSQEEIVKESYKNFEANEDKRRELSKLLIPYSTSIGTSDDRGLSAKSKFFNIPLDTWYIVWENVKIKAPGTCYDENMIGVVPTTHDEYNLSTKNPFRKENERRALRLDTSLGGGARVVEIISHYEPASYHMRYVKRPKPIILTDLSVNYPGLSIGGLTAVTECELNDEIHRNILNRAVELAIGSYRENSLQNKVELNKRSV